MNSRPYRREKSPFSNSSGVGWSGLELGGKRVSCTNKLTSVKCFRNGETNPRCHIAKPDFNDKFGKISYEINYRNA